jgi:hypothetical protein
MRFLASVRGDRSKALDLDADKARKRLLRRGHDLNELLRENVVTKFYLDRDLYLDSAQEPTPEEIAKAEAEVRDRVSAIAQALTTTDVKLTYKIATRHGFSQTKKKWKLSFRPFLLGMKIRYTGSET